MKDDNSFVKKGGVVISLLAQLVASDIEKENNQQHL
jgi:hypothetical protein